MPGSRLFGEQSNGADVQNIPSIFLSLELEASFKTRFLVRIISRTNILGPFLHIISNISKSKPFRRHKSGIIVISKALDFL